MLKNVLFCIILTSLIPAFAFSKECKSELGASFKPPIQGVPLYWSAELMLAAGMMNNSSAVIVSRLVQKRGERSAGSVTIIKFAENAKPIVVAGPVSQLARKTRFPLFPIKQLQLESIRAEAKVEMRS
jgi:hypothetical protein